MSTRQPRETYPTDLPLVDWLRRKADAFTRHKTGNQVMAAKLREAADTIEQLRNRCRELESKQEVAS